MKRERIVYLDVLRSLACLMIIIMHSPMPDIGDNSYILSSISMLTAPGIGLFFMVSGALLLPIRMSHKDFLKKRLYKILFPTLFWTIFYLLVKIHNGQLSWDALPLKVLSIPFSTQGNSILWFMYTLTGLYLLAPIITPWLEKASKHELEFVLGVWGITLFFPMLNDILNINESRTGMLYYFTGYAGYFLLGYYLKKYANHLSIVIMSLLFLIPIAIATFLKSFHIDIDFYKWFWYLCIFTAMMAAGWFLVAKKYTNYLYFPLLEKFSNCCFGIYLVHIFIMRHILWRMDFIQSYGCIAQIVMTVVLTTMISYAIVWLISKLPFAEFIIGYKERK